MKNRTEITDVSSMLPTMASDALATLRDNAKRLERTGTAAQQKAATALLPALSEEISRRTPPKPAPAAPATTRKRVVKPKA